MNTLIINHFSLDIGGIETIIHTLMIQAIDMHYRVIWLTTKTAFKNAKFRDIADSPEVEKVYVRKTAFGIDYPRIDCSEHEDALMLSFDPIWYMFAESLKRHLETGTIYHFFVFPHFTGNAYYPERNFRSNLIYTIVKNYFRSFYRDLDNRRLLLGCDEKHLKSCEQNYGFEISETKSKILTVGDSIRPKRPYETLVKLAKQRQHIFNIVTCARLDFPHKGYILGLVDCFSKLKARHHQLSLTIIGDGKDREQLLKKVSEFRPEIRSAIHLTGSLLPEEVIQEYKKAHLIVGVAGALMLGASCTVPCISMRHYTTRCEGYGFVGPNMTEILSDDPGNDMESVIESAVVMSGERYISLAYDAYKYSNRMKDDDQPSLMGVARLASLAKRSDGSLSLYSTPLLRRILYIHRGLCSKVLRIPQCD